MAAKLLFFCGIYKYLQSENAIDFRLFAIKMCNLLLLFEIKVVILQP